MIDKYKVKEVLIVFLSVLMVACQLTESNTAKIEAQVVEEPSTKSVEVKKEAAKVKPPQLKKLDSDKAKILKEVELVNTSDYDAVFVKELKANFPVTKLSGDTIWGADGYFELFPALPYRTDKATTFVAKEKGKKYTLLLSRRNATSLKYSLIINDGNGRQKKVGKLHLSPSFLLADEIDTDPKTGEGFPVVEYTSMKECYQAIRIGQPKENGPAVVRLVFDCKDIQLSLEGSPVLWEDR